MATILDGRAIAKEYDRMTKDRVAWLKKWDWDPRLAIIQVGDDIASDYYAKSKVKECNNVGIECEIIKFHSSIKEEELKREVAYISESNRYHGILVLLPLPHHINESNILKLIDPTQDVDGTTPENLGNLAIGEYGAYLEPCTPKAIMHILKRYDINVKGKHCVVVGRGRTVGKPLSLMLTREDATVTLCHSKTEDLSEHTKRADILISAVGKPKFITEDMVKDGAVVIDAGINQDENGKLCGDVDFVEVSNKVSYITPVPGGVGAVTSSVLLRNVVSACELYSSRCCGGPYEE